MFLSAAMYLLCFFFFFQAEDGIRDVAVIGFQTCALPISSSCAAFLESSEKAAHDEEGLSFPRESFPQADMTAVKLSCARHKLSPGRKLCSMLVRKIGRASCRERV